MAKSFDIDVQEISDWNCCGSTAAHNLNRELSLLCLHGYLLSPRNKGFQKLLSPVPHVTAGLQLQA